MNASQVLLVAAIALISARARADEHTDILERSGDWVAGEHRASLTDPPDVCIAFNEESHFFLRSGDDRLEIRIENDKWSLPTDTKGQIHIVARDFDNSFEISFNTNNTVAAIISTDDALALFKAMDADSSMEVTTGKDKRTVSLVGSTKVTNAFRTCAGISGAPSDPSSNPFN